MNLVIGFGPNPGLALWPRAKPINKTMSKPVRVMKCTRKELEVMAVLRQK